MATTTVSISEAKQRLGEIADRAIEGEHILIVNKIKAARPKAAGITGTVADSASRLFCGLLRPRSH